MAGTKRDLNAAQTARLKRTATHYKVVSLRIGSRKFSLPVEARLLEDGEFAFLSIPSFSGVFRPTNAGYEPVPASDSNSAIEQLKKIRPAKAKMRTRKTSQPVPEAVLQAMTAVPRGYRVVEKDGEYRLKKLRSKRL